MGIAAKHGITIVPHHLNSHQDDNVEYQHLPWEAELNCDFDSLAGKAPRFNFFLCNQSTIASYILPPGHGATLCLEEMWVTSHLPTVLREVSYRKEAQKCWRNYFGKENPGINYLLHIESNESKRIWYQRKLRIRKQSTSPVKPIILLKLLGTITIDYCNIVVHIYSLFGPWRVITGYKKAIEGFWDAISTKVHHTENGLGNQRNLRHGWWIGQLVSALAWN